MNIYCFSTLSFAKLQFKSVINKAFHKHGVASFTDAWIETEKQQQKKMKQSVASFTDAWIETISEGVTDRPETVASFTDAWIETWSDSYIPYKGRSHLLQMRGLKHRDAAVFKLQQDVASFTDAWIETVPPNSSIRIKPSHLLQMRGLKQKRCATSTGAQSRIFYRCVD